MWHLGETPFIGLAGFDSFDVSREAEYAEQPRAGTKARLQRVGDKLEEINLSLRLHSFFCVPEDELDKLETSRRVGYILGLVSAAGRYFGDFLITSLNYRIESAWPDGTFQVLTISISLKEYWYDDRAAAERRRARAGGFALPQNASPLPLAPQSLPSRGGPAAQAAKLMAALATARSMMGTLSALTRIANGPQNAVTLANAGFLLLQLSGESARMASQTSAAAGVPVTGPDTPPGMSFPIAGPLSGTGGPTGTAQALNAVANQVRAARATGAPSPTLADVAAMRTPTEESVRVLADTAAPVLAAAASRQNRVLDWTTLL